jgi:hypothetical protein
MSYYQQSFNFSTPESILNFIFEISLGIFDKEMMNIGIKFTLKILLYKKTLLIVCLIMVFSKFINYSQNEEKNREILEIFKNKTKRAKYEIHCMLLFEDDDNERSKALKLLETLRGNSSKIDLLPDSNFIFSQSMCSHFRELRGYDKHKVNDLERDFPLAFIILMNKDVEQFERLLRTIYRPQNVYCIHVDEKSSGDVKQAVESIASCFDNVFIPTRIESVFWGYNTLLKAQLNCMSDLLNLNWLINQEKHPNLKNKRVIEWKYLLNAASTFLPLRTNLELVRIFDLYNGSSDIEIFIDSYAYRWKTIWSFDFKSKRLYNTKEQKKDPPHNFKISKGSNYLAASRTFVDYIINSKYGRDIAEWGMDMVFCVLFN